ncbi:hypothetical protein ACLSU7_16690 [Bdellovibrio sp. HCB185ZH]|uniref:hypothetical protein n=1 Tax=Bdellovibrio sp. HCB185ZH TaxID=3394235 RepID=UPI0039A780D9
MRFSSVLFVAAMVVAIQSKAANVCVNNMADFEQRKAQMPPMMQKLPVMFTVDSFAVTAGLKIAPAGNKLQLEANVNAIGSGDDYQQVVYIKEVCIIGDKVTMKLEAGASKRNEPPPTISLVDSGSVKINSITFKKSTEAQFRSISNKVSKDLGGSSGSGGVK